MGAKRKHNIPYPYNSIEYRHEYYQRRKKGMLENAKPHKRKYTLTHTPVTAGSLRKNEPILYEDDRYIFYVTNRIWSKMAEKYLKLHVTNRRKYYIIKYKDTVINININLSDNINEYITDNP